MRKTVYQKSSKTKCIIFKKTVGGCSTYEFHSYFPCSYYIEHTFITVTKFKLKGSKSKNSIKLITQVR